MQTRFSVKRGHSAAVYTSGRRSTSVAHQNTLFSVSHTGAPVDTRGLSMCETLIPKKVSIPALEREKNMFSAWNSAKIDNCTTLPSNVSYSYFLPQISVC
ncbi:hypothetical protein AB205_0025120 [Aquarana catesbeiana]|uniref:Uncharacterized protein n=1 Tax=Aquarana catesbeiana TaxID=8400 RepID=A0A2G9Q8L5_AQUCT|nr:hypothetical protein AB205_0025120 [Aquarana catesbeiana]